MTDATTDIDRSSPVSARAELFIAAPPEIVWSTLADVASWPSWNGDVARTEVQGPLEPGTRFRWKAGGMAIRSTLLQVEPPAVLTWSGVTLGVRAVHVSRFEPEGDGTRAVTEESFDGLLPRLLRGRMRKMLETSLERGLEALAAEAKRRAGTGT